jgi:hypothetical protein
MDAEGRITHGAVTEAAAPTEDSTDHCYISVAEYPHEISPFFTTSVIWNFAPIKV